MYTIKIDDDEMDILLNALNFNLDNERPQRLDDRAALKRLIDKVEKVEPEEVKDSSRPLGAIK